MNSLNSVLSGLFSSLLLSLGFSRLAAKFDQLNQDTAMHSVNPNDLRSSSFCVLPCRWQEVDTAMNSVNPNDLRSSSFCVLPCRWQEV